MEGAIKRRTLCLQTALLRIDHGAEVSFSAVIEGKMLRRVRKCFRVSRILEELSKSRSLPQAKNPSSFLDSLRPIRWH